MLLFPVSGVEVSWWLPPLAACVVSLFTSMVGVSGAFLLMPFQMSVLGYASPSASATNLVFNLFATPGGIWRYARLGRMVWPLAWVFALGSLPGIVAGFYLRALWLPDAARFKLLVGAVMLYLAWRLLGEFAPWRKQAASPLPLVVGSVTMLQADTRRMLFAVGEARFAVAVPALVLLSLVVGVIGGTYGIGGGAIVAPFCIAVLRLPVAVVAGAALVGTFATSVLGVLVYTLLPLPGGGSAAPDWALGALLGGGGLVGMTLGAGLQQHVPQRILKFGLGLLVAGLGSYYLSGR
ncbi:MAG: sulfite exporter TauE/SafE family protein [Betaproteobacteria bacterium]|nr:sulfite exporter TauE/SafE family protein [Betaproteobacteria bacterium]